MLGYLDYNKIKIIRYNSYGPGYGKINYKAIGNRDKIKNNLLMRKNMIIFSFIKGSVSTSKYYTLCYNDIWINYQPDIRNSKIPIQGKTINGIMRTEEPLIV